MRRLILVWVVVLVGCASVPPVRLLWTCREGGSRELGVYQSHAAMKRADAAWWARVESQARWERYGGGLAPPEWVEARFEEGARNVCVSHWDRRPSGSPIRVPGS